MGYCQGNAPLKNSTFVSEILLSKDLLEKFPRMNSIFAFAQILAIKITTLTIAVYKMNRYVHTEVMMDLCCVDATLMNLTLKHMPPALCSLCSQATPMVTLPSQRNTLCVILPLLRLTIFCTQKSSCPSDCLTSSADFDR